MIFNDYKDLADRLTLCFKVSLNSLTGSLRALAAQSGNQGEAALILAHTGFKRYAGSLHQTKDWLEPTGTAATLQLVCPLVWQFLQNPVKFRE